MTKLTNFRVHFTVDGEKQAPMDIEACTPEQAKMSVQHRFSHKQCIVKKVKQVKEAKK